MRYFWLAMLIVFGWASAQEPPSVTDLKDGRVGRFLFLSAQRGTIPLEVQRSMVFYQDQVEANLLLPNPKFAPPYPAVIQAHSSGGVSKRDYEWSKWFLDQGIAVLVLDSFKRRGILESSTDQSRLTIAANTVDNLLALKMLKTHPKIDGNRIGLIGFSRGGAVVSMASIESVVRPILGSDTDFAFLVSFYGTCVYRGEKYTKSPMLLLIGDQDSYENMESCQEWKQHIQTYGDRYELVIYPGVHHGFDNKSFEIRRDLANAETGKFCKVEWNLDQRKYRVGNELPSWDSTMNEYVRRCRTRGTIVEYNENAFQDSRRRIRDLMLKQSIIR